MELNIEDDGCKCSPIPATKKTEETEKYIVKAKLVHGDKHNYDKTEYVNVRTNVIIFCIKHEEYFSQRPNTYLINKFGCPKCISENCTKIYEETRKSDVTRKRMIQKDEFIEKTKEMNDRYTYDEMSFVAMSEKMKIFCKLHKEWFEQNPQAHWLEYHGCKKCRRSYRSSLQTKPIEDFLIVIYYKIPAIG